MGYKRRTKMISFRLSEREFEQLRLISEAQGARSVSDYARLTLCQEAPEVQVKADTEVQRLSGTLYQLSQNVRRLVELLEVRSARVSHQDGRAENA